MKITILPLVLSLVFALLTTKVFASNYHKVEDIQQKIINEAQRQNLSPSLALALAKVESDFNPQAVSHAGARGVMQIMPGTAEQVFGVSRKRLFEPDLNIQLGIQFINQLLDRYNGRLDIALSHYNGGSGVKNRRGELNVIPATQNYVEKVLSSQQDFLQYDRRPTLSSRLDASGRLFVYDEQEPLQLEVNVEESEPRSDNPQINRLRALRLHNITRNYQSIGAKLPHPLSEPSIKQTSAQESLNAKRIQVRQWESIYPD